MLINGNGNGSSLSKKGWSKDAEASVQVYFKSINGKEYLLPNGALNIDESQKSHEKREGQPGYLLQEMKNKVVDEILRRVRESETGVVDLSDFLHVKVVRKKKVTNENPDDFKVLFG